MITQNQEFIEEPLTRGRLPATTTEGVDAINCFLWHWLERIDKSLNDHKALLMQGGDKRLAGVIAYQRHQLATLKTLISSNEGRRVKR